MKKVLRKIKRYYMMTKPFLRNLFLKIHESKISILVILLVVAIFIVAFKLEIHYQKANGFFDGNFWLDNLLPNIIADMIGIIFTSFIIAGLFARHQKKNEEKRLRDILGHDFNRLIDELSRNFLYLLDRDEKILTYIYHDYMIQGKLKNIGLYGEDSFNFSTFSNNFRVWNTNEGSPIYDCFVFMIGQIEKHEKIAWSHLADVDELFLKKGKIELELKEISKGSNKYNLKVDEYNQISEELRYKTRLKMSMDEELLDVKIREVLLGFIKFYNNKIQMFCDKYNFIIPIEVRSIFAEILKHLSLIEYNVDERNDLNTRRSLSIKYNSIEEYDDMLKKNILNSVVFISQELFKLSGYFKSL